MKAMTTKELKQRITAYQHAERIESFGKAVIDLATDDRFDCDSSVIYRYLRGKIAISKARAALIRSATQNQNP